MSAMQIFVIRLTGTGDKVWMAAHTNIEALQQYCDTSGMRIVDFMPEDSVDDIKYECWEDCFTLDADNNRNMSFVKWMDQNPEGGKIRESFNN
jgi:hypothetical protein